MKNSIMLSIDALINFILGLLLLICSEKIMTWLGIPVTTQYFYPNVLGGVLIGIAAALLIEAFRKPGGPIGLGLGGAIAINLCGGLILAYWLLFKNLTIPSGGRIFLWSLVVVLVMISSIELNHHFHKNVKKYH